MSEFATKARALLFDWQQVMNSKDIRGRMNAGMQLFQGGKELYNAVAHRSAAFCYRVAMSSAMLWLTALCPLALVGSRSKANMQQMRLRMLSQALQDCDGDPAATIALTVPFSAVDAVLGARPSISGPACALLTSAWHACFQGGAGAGLEGNRSHTRPPRCGVLLERVQG